MSSDEALERLKRQLLLRGRTVVEVADCPLIQDTVNYLGFEFNRIQGILRWMRETDRVSGGNRERAELRSISLQHLLVSWASKGVAPKPSSVHTEHPPLLLTEKIGHGNEEPTEA